MTREEIINEIKTILEELDYPDAVSYLTQNDREWLEATIKALEQEPCEMTAEEYRQRMIQAFHNAGTDELIAVCVLPTEKEFEHLEWLLKNHYKQEPCENWYDVPSDEMTLEQARQAVKDLRKYVMDNHILSKSGDTISRQAAIDALGEKPLAWVDGEYELGLQNQWENDVDAIKTLLPKTGHWIDTGSGQECSECHEIQYGYDNHRFYCGNCGCRMVESQERSDKE